MPSHIKTYDGSKDPEDHIKIFQAAVKTERWTMPTWCHMFNSTLTENARMWFDDLPTESIDNYDDLKKNSGNEQPKAEKKGKPSGKDKALAILMVQPWKKVARQKITQSFSLNAEILFPPLNKKEGTEGPMIIETEIGGHCIHRIGEIIWPIGQIQLLVMIGDEEHSALAWMNFIVVMSPSPYNEIIRRPGVRKLQAVPSTTHEMLKLPVEGGVITLKSSRAFHKQIRRNLEVYVDDLVSKSRTEDEIVRDIEETFKTLREINMKLNPKKCTFGVEEGIASHANRTNGKGETYRLLSGSQRNEVEEELPEPWILFTNGSSYTDGSGAGHILTNPEGVEFTFTLTFSEVEILVVVEEEGDTWMTPIFEYLTKETLPADVKKSKSRPLQANYILREIHEGTCNMHAGTRSVVAKSLRIGYYWPTMHKDARTIIRTCQDCQVHKHVLRNPHQQSKPHYGRWNKSKIGCREQELIGRTFLCSMDTLHHDKFSNGDTLFSLTYGTEAVIPTEIGMSTLRTAEVDLIQNDEALGINLDLLEEKREQAAIREAKSKAKMEKYYNSKVRSASFKSRDLVYRNNDASRAKDTMKLGPKW
nr:hypothetical protein [Tanacetum cinerariifolium]